MVELTGEAALLREKKNFDELFRRMCATKTGIDAWNELCRTDEEVMGWYMELMKESFKKLAADPELAATAREMFSDDAKPLFDLYMNASSFGFVTIEEMADAFGGTVEDIKETASRIPKKYRGKKVEVM